MARRVAAAVPSNTSGPFDVIGEWPGPSPHPDGSPLEPGRSRAAAETVRDLQPYLAGLGITRLACQTGLDRIGIPVWAAMRPNSLSLAVNQGKGIDDDGAKASALMEAAEFAVAERPDADVSVASRAELLARGEALFEPTRLLPPGAALPGEAPISWLDGRQLLTGTPVRIPLEAARLDLTEPDLADDVFAGLSRSSSGLASGNDETEAVLHAVCELVERDALTLFSTRAAAAVRASRIEPSAFASAAVDALVARIRDAGFAVDLFDMTTDIAIPVVQAVIRETRGPVRMQLDLAAGVGCHASAAQAAVRAIIEAAQTRITHIAGARDDIDPAEYDEALRPGLGVYLEPAGPAPARRPPSIAEAVSPTAPALLEAVKARLASAGIVDIPVAVLGGARQGIAVAKAFAPQLEDKPANRNWRPGRRMASRMLRLW